MTDAADDFDALFEEVAAQRASAPAPAPAPAPEPAAGGDSALHRQQPGVQLGQRRIARGGVRHVVANAGDVDKFSGVPGEYTRLSVGAADGWSDLHGSYRRVGDVPPTEHPGTAPSDPLLY